LGEDASFQEKILIFVDQFEEVFAYRERTQSQDGGNEAALFVDLLLTAVTDPTVPLYVVLTMRTDYLGECALFRGLSEALSDGSYLVPRLSRLRQQEAIERPAAALGVKMQPDLVQRLLNDSEGDPDKLPVLQHLLKALWERRADQLDLSLYKKVGGWQHALEKDAEKVLKNFSEEEEGIRRMFQWLSDAGTGGKPVRRRVPTAEFPGITSLAAERVKAILQAFAERGFLRCETGDAELVDFTHESVMWQWPKLQMWIAAEAEEAGRIRFLLEATKQRQFLSGSTLKEAQAFQVRADSSPLWFSRYVASADDRKKVLAWIAKSKQKQQEDAEAREKARQREESRRRTLIWLGSALLVVSLIAAVSLTINYFSARKNFAALQEKNTQLNKAKTDLDDLTNQLSAALQQTTLDRKVGRSADLAKEYLKQSTKAVDKNRAGITVQYFAKESELSANPELIPSLQKLGFTVQTTKPNFELPSNKIWYGSQVDRLSVQAVAYSVLSNGIALRQIGTLADSNLDKGREKVIQVGWSKEAENLALLTPADIQALQIMTPSAQSPIAKQ
jgi:hypothetical protein